ncbi:MAG: metallophosphoesterase family protein [Planctomycetota bacterium]|jgi:hypothetical protein
MFAFRSETTTARSTVASKINGGIRATCVCIAFLLAVSPAIGSAQEPWRFIVTCDSRGRDDGIEKTVLSELVTEILSRDVDFVLFPGDLVSGHSASGPAEFEYQLRVWVEMMEPVYGNDIAVYVSRGNHEIADVWSAYPLSYIDPNDNFTKRWLDVFGSDLYPEQKLPDNGPTGEKFMTYSVTHKNSLIVSLDQYAGLGHEAVHKVNQRWLDAQLAANVEPHIFVAGHEPAFRALHSDCLDNQPSDRDAFWAGIRNAGGRTYFCGHDHFYDHARVDDGDGKADNDIHQYIIGGAGAPPYHWLPPYLGDNSYYTVEQWHHAEGYGYTLVEIDGPDVTLTWMERLTRDLEVPGIYEPRDVWSYTVVPGLIVLSPNGNESLAAASPHTIRWKTLNDPDVNDVTIDYSSDNGQSWRQVARWPNTGFYEWNSVPTMDSTQCLVRIADVRDASVSDISDETFTIFECQKQLAADLNGDCYVDFLDFAIFAGEWLKCGNPFDASCD